MKIFNTFKKVIKEEYNYRKPFSKFIMIILFILILITPILMFLNYKNIINIAIEPFIFALLISLFINNKIILIKLEYGNKNAVNNNKTNEDKNNTGISL